MSKSTNKKKKTRSVRKALNKALDFMIKFGNRHINHGYGTGIARGEMSDRYNKD